MLELQQSSLVFTFPEIHPKARLTITFQRTLRIPDDGKTYPLPPGLGAFPMRHVDDFKDRVPASWLKHGGVMLPMYQSEALWINFNSQYIPDHMTSYPFAVKVGAGKRSAVTGKPWSKSLREDDYCVVPKQPWLDGFVVEKGRIRQFVAAPLGMDLTAEAQLSGKEEFGGIQIEVVPMRPENFLRRWPKQECLGHRRRITRSCSLSESLSFNVVNDASVAAAGLEMGLGAGGSMKQEVYEDPFGLSEWDTEVSSRCFVHLANSLTWRAITREEPPTVPQTAAEYARYGLPWYDHYADGKVLGATEKMKGLKSILELGFQKGLKGVLPENESVSVRPSKVVQTGPKPGSVRDGVWK